MKPKASPLIIAVIVSLIVIVAGLSHALLKHPPYAPAINAEQHSDSGLKAEQNNNEKRSTADNATTGAPRIGSEGGCGKCQSKAEHGEEEGTEFWPAFLGYRLKITDTLVAAFTALLFFATVALWVSTRNLVRGAEKTAERQLRAYVFATAARVRHFAINEPVEIEVLIRNTGQTPAYGVYHCMSIAMSNPPLRLDELDFSDAPKGAMGPAEVSSSFAHFGPDYKLPEGSFRAVRSEKAALWVYGEIRYEDAFGKPRWTKFRFIYTGNTVTDPPGGMALDAEGNEAT
jgi:hypothetical protein